MIPNWTRRYRVPGTAVPAALDEHHAIKKIGRLLIISIGVLVLSAVVLLVTVTQIRLTLEQRTIAAERARAANAIDLVGQSGPLTARDAEMIGRIAGLTDARLLSDPITDPALEVMPLLGEQGAPGSYLAWRTNPFADDLFLQFAPVRMPIVGAMLFAVIALMLRLRLLVRDIERQRRVAHRQSRTDVVTGLANRRAFEIAMDELTAAATPFGIIIFDLDHFKAVNDALGHAAGDMVLRTVGLRLSGLLGQGDLLARLGGDEFVMLRVSAPDAAALDTLARACIALIEQPIEGMGRSVRVGASLGIVADVGGGLLPSTVLGAADAALYRAKSRTNSSFEFAGLAPDHKDVPHDDMHLLPA